MPQISVFYGIVITMYLGEQHHVPHFHARYGKHRISVAVNTLGPLAGSLPPRAFRMVREWAALHQEELLACWDRARRGEHPGTIEPLR